MISVWHDGGSRAGIKYEEDAPPIFYCIGIDDFEEEIAQLKVDGEKIQRVDQEKDLEREIVF